jgi:hypothetical protein
MSRGNRFSTIQRRYGTVPTNVDEFKEFVNLLLFKNDPGGKGTPTNNYIQRSDELQHLFNTLADVLLSQIAATETGAKTHLISIAELKTYDEVVALTEPENITMTVIEHDVAVVLYTNYIVYFEYLEGSWSRVDFEKRNYKPVKTINASTMIDMDKDGLVLVDASNGPITIFLPLANSRPVNENSVVDIKVIDDTHTVTIIPQGGNTIESGVTKTLSLMEAASPKSDGNTKWYLR